MIIFFYGQDSYRAKQELNETIDRQKKAEKSGACLNYFSGQDLTLDNFRNASSNNSIFGGKNIIVLRDVFSNEVFKEEFLKNGKAFVKSDVLILIYEEDGVDKRDSLFKFLQKSAECREFQPLNEKELSDWARKEFSKYNQEIDARALEKLVLFVNYDLWLLSNEIKKLSGFCRSRKITQEDVDLLVRQNIENDIFKTIDALAKKNKKEALGLIHNHLSQGDSPLYLLSMICFQFRNLLEIRDLMERKTSYGDMASKSALHPFVIKKTYWAAQKFTFSQLKKIYRKILQVDLSIKTGKIEPEAALDLLIAGI